MANKKISELESRASLSLSDLMAVGDPSTGYLYKTTISDLKTLTGAGVVSFNGRFGTVNPAEGDYTLTQLGDVIITSATNGQVLQYNGSNWVNSSLNLTTTLAALTDVAISSIANNQLLRYNSTSQKWENWTANYLTAESDTLDTVTTRGATTSNGITVGSVSAAGLSNLLGQIRTFATTGNTYIGASPASASDAGYKLDLNGTARISGDMTMWDDGTNNGNSRALIFRALGSTGNAQTGQIILDGFGAAGQDQLQLSASSIRLSPSTGSVTITGTTPNISTVAASGFRLNANSTTNGFIFTQAYNQTSGDLLAVFTNSNQKKFSIAASDSSVTIASLAGTGSRMVVADANGVMSTQAIPTSAVSSVFGRTGAVVAANGDYTTSQVTEGTNLYYTDARSRAAISAGTGISYNSTTGVVSSTITQYTDALARASVSLTTTGSSGAATYNSTTGVFNIPTYTLAGLGGQPALSGTGFVKISGTTISYDNSTYLTTSSAASTYLPLAGGTLTGALNGTAATFSGQVQASSFTDGFITMGAAQINRSGTVELQFAGAGDVRIFGNTAYPIRFAAGTGAATFSSSIDATIANLSLGLKVTGSNLTTGTGAEIVYSSGKGIFLTYNRGASTYLPTEIDGSTVTLSTSANPRLTVTSAGDVLIGTTLSSGNARLLVSQSLSYTNSGDSRGHIHIANTNTTANNRASLQYYNSSLIVVAGIDAVLTHTQQTGALQFWTVQDGGLRDTMRLTNGNVGINTTNPGALLHLAVASASVDGTKGVRITNPAGTVVMLECGVSSDSFVGTTSVSDFQIRTGNTERLRISSTGVATFSNDVKVKTLEVTNVGTDAGSSGLSTYMRITVNGQNYLIPLHGTP